MNHFTAKLEINPKSLEQNFNILKTIAKNAEIAPVVKANAYGIGVDNINQSLINLPIKTCFVARLSEGISLRKQISPSTKIYVLDGCEASELGICKTYNLSPVINTVTQWQAFQQTGDTLQAALHIDTGMNRLGMRFDQVSLLNIKSDSSIDLYMSHMACADVKDDPLNRMQKTRFDEACLGLPIRKKSLAASSGIFHGKDYHYDMVRPGICLYGGGPFGEAEPRIQPVSHLKAKILQVLSLHVGDTVGYGKSYTASRPMTIATLGIGYADGILRSLSPLGTVFVDGKVRPIIGRVSMDLLAVDISETDAHKGDWVELWGANIPIDQQAKAANTISYELLTRLGPRVLRQVIS